MPLPEITDGSITNLPELENYIKNLSNLELLKELLEELNSLLQQNIIVNDGGLRALLLERIKELSSPFGSVVPLDPNEHDQDSKILAPTIITIDLFKSYLSKLYNGEILTSEEELAMAGFMESALQKMETGELDYDLQNAIDMYVAYCEQSDGLTQAQQAILDKYKQIIEKRNAEKNINNNMVLTLQPPKEEGLTTDGAIFTIAIIEVTILLGILISVLVLVNR